MKFRTLVDAGATAEEFLAHIPRCVAEGKRFAYLLGAVFGERERVAENGGKLHAGTMPESARAAQIRAMSGGLASPKPVKPVKPAKEIVDVDSRIVG